MRGGKTVLLVSALFDVLGVQEAHHWIEAIEQRAYDPGVVTSFAYVLVGALVLTQVRRTWPLQPLEAAAFAINDHAARRARLIDWGG